MNEVYDIYGSFGYDSLLKVMHSIPSCIFFKDTDLRYVFSTQHWEQLNTDSVLGKTDLEIRKDIENAKLAMDADRNILETGKGCKYTIKSDIDGHVTYLELIKEPVFDDLGKPIGIVGLINDITDKILTEQRLKELSTRDALTKLYNRRAGVELIENSLKDSTDNKYFMLLDLNKFKHINDTYGHQTGDVLLQKVSNALRQNLQQNDIALRLGGDEFIILVNCSSLEKIQEYIKSLLSDIKSIKLLNTTDEISASVGIVSTENLCTFDDLYKKADELMYKAKKAGINCIFNDENDEIK